MTSKSKKIIGGMVTTGVGGAVAALLTFFVVSPTTNLPGFRPSYYCPAGFPTSTNDVIVLLNEGYAVGYSEGVKNPLWAAYRLFAVTNEAPSRPSMKFKADDRTASEITHDDYTGSGYDRGHMAPSYAMGLCYGADAQRGTFIMSNIIPQTPNLNRGSWRALEAVVADGIAQRLGEIWVATGPVFTGDVARLEDGVRIPDACYKIVAFQTNGVWVSVSFLIPQDAPRTAHPTNYATSVDYIENLTSLDFFSGLPNDIENQMEARR